MLTVPVVCNYMYVDSHRASDRPVSHQPYWLMPFLAIKHTHNGLVMISGDCRLALQAVLCITGTHNDVIDSSASGAHNVHVLIVGRRLTTRIKAMMKGWSFAHDKILAK